MPLILAQHGLVKVSYTMRKTNSGPLIRNKVEEANKAVVKGLEWKMVQ